MTAMPRQMKRSAGLLAPAERNNPPLLDKAHVNQLCAVLGSTRVEALFDLLSKELASRPALIRDAVIAGDVSRARHESHSFKGAATSIGAMALGEAAARIEHAPDLDAMTAVLPALDRQAARTMDAITGLLASTSSDLEDR
jgi:HPt (histidine-containing phosphotransfer) domain-containing protein